MKPFGPVFITSIVALLFSGSSGTETKSGNERTSVVICFDVEDYTSPESAGMDDIPAWLAEIMTEEGVTGSFFVIGEKARSMEERGRMDVTEAMTVHDIGSHTNFGSIHPTVTELLESADWQNGVSIMKENERAGFDDLERIFGQRPANLARHGGSYGPQLVYVLGQMGAGFVYSPISLPGHNAVWFCNTLNFHGEGNFGFFDDAYYRDDLFDPMLEALDSLIPAETRDMDVVAFFANHPSKIRSIQFWDFNYYKGANPGPDQWQTPELRPLESMETAKKNFRRLVRYLDDRDDIELTTFRELTHRFSYQRDSITPEDLERISKRILEENKVVIDDHYSPAEVFAALTDVLEAYGTEYILPGQLAVRRPLGPLEMPARTPECEWIPSEEVLVLAGEAREIIGQTGHLPASLPYEDQLMGTGSLLALFSELYLQIRQQSVPPFLDVVPMDPYPSLNEEMITREVASMKSWPVHREDLEMDHLIELTLLQLWTLKPASTAGS